MANQSTMHTPNARSGLEKSLGITEHVSPIDWGWYGEPRKRFTDFQVYEIRKDGRVLHLSTYEEVEEKDAQDRRPQVQESSASVVSDAPEPSQPSPDDRKLLEGIIGDFAAAKLIELDQTIQKNMAASLKESQHPVVFPAIGDREKRGFLHREIRRIFSGRLDTGTDNTGVITAFAAKTRGSRGWNNSRNASSQQSSNAQRGSSDPRNSYGVRKSSTHPDQYKSWGALGGEYIHVTLYKENKDTMDAINQIARMLKIKATNFGFSGTKDRRASTVQRISIYRQKASNLIWLNNRLPQVKLGDFKYSKFPIQLGQHAGNEFIIALKNCIVIRGVGSTVYRRLEMMEEAVRTALAHVHKRGFINYFGLQRFGTHTIGTHELGMKILMGNFQGAVDDLLHVDAAMLESLDANGAEQAESSSQEDQKRAKVIIQWKLTRDADTAISQLPKRFSAEASIIRHLSRPETRQDFMGALLTITRGMRQMYVHAYQSYVWNFVASLRWSKYGTQVLEGDLVFVSTSRNITEVEGEALESNQDDEHFFAEVRRLNANDILENKYTIFDVVLPTPGYDVQYPGNDIGDYYATFMGRPENGSLNPYDMRRRQKEFSLSGSYRLLMGRFRDFNEPGYIIRAYTNDHEQMHPTDLDIISHHKMEEKKRADQKRGDADATAPKFSTESLSGWQAFSKNPQQFDQVIANDRRRRRAEEPEVVGETQTKDVWLETSLDRDAKRVRIGRHVVELGGDKNITITTSDAVDTFDATDNQASETPKAGAGSSLFHATVTDSDSTDFVEPLAAKYESLQAIGTITSAVQESLAIKPEPLASAAPRTGAMMSMSEYYYNSIKEENEARRGDVFAAAQEATKPSMAEKFLGASEAKMHGELSSDPANNTMTISGDGPGLSGPATINNPGTGDEQSQYNTSPAADGSTELKAPKPDGMKLWDPVTSPDFPTPDASWDPSKFAKKTTEPQLPVPEEPKPELPVPKFNLPSAGKSTDFGCSVDDLTEAHKIAVILKFELPSSCYATIVLRELMGTVTDNMINNRQFDSNRGYHNAARNAGSGDSGGSRDADTSARPGGGGTSRGNDG